ncbi:hypothetical protein P691DRAFT_775045 [Macrolepiota fuliginosa MF-IS2]|uniref:F-box domain-containing protein n=1 Tax=Macrolepiota fuliginosa MF-IS2 TaxID=1400762 RepID=A0A9P6C1X7_9AGAR|nr:hypothetical protein P691DRAFT_775045 [Macrolepiota fuliginosa MF-IS2]
MSIGQGSEVLRASGSPLDEIRFIENGTLRLDGLILQLRNKRADLLRRLNTIHSSTSVLPYEIISSIFQHVSPPIDFESRDFRTEYAHRPVTVYQLTKKSDFEDPGPFIPVMLGVISSHWRSIAWSTQELWTSIALEVKEAKAQSQACLLDLYFRNAKDLRVSLELDFREYFRSNRAQNSSGDESALAPMHAVILKYASKIHSFRLSAVPSGWVNTLSGVFTSLADLALGWPTNGQVNPSHQFSFVDIVTLRRVTIRRLWAPLKLPWTQIVVLDLDRMTIDTCVELLIGCRNLEEYSVREPSFTPSDRRHPSLDGIITLDNLRNLIWSCLPDAWSIAMLDHVRFSRLEQLEWHGFPGDQNRNRFRGFFAQLPLTLQTLGLARCDSSEGLHDILSNVPQLAHLRLLACQSRFCLSVIHCLTPHISRETQEPVLLPVLSFLTVDRCDEMQQFGLKGSLLFQEFLVMLRGRSTALTNQDFGLHFKPHIRWRTEVQQILKKAVREGVNLKIVEGDKVVDWL